MFCYNSVHVALTDFWGLNLNFLVEEVLFKKKKPNKKMQCYIVAARSAAHVCLVERYCVSGII